MLRGGDPTKRFLPSRNLYGYRAKKADVHMAGGGAPSFRESCHFELIDLSPLPPPTSYIASLTSPTPPSPALVEVGG